MSTILEHPEAIIKIKELPSGKKSIQISSEHLSIPSYDAHLETKYPLELIKRILQVKGPLSLCDEIRREEDPNYIKICLEKDILAYRSKQDFKNKRILDFGCGSGASSIILAKMFPDAEIIGIDLVEKLISLASFRANQCNLNNVSFIRSNNEKELPKDFQAFDYILLSAVVEHLLPEERMVILSQLWSLLKPNGVLFVNQTPYRFFPFEGHTTHLPLINYLPDKLAHFCACKFSKRVKSHENWAGLLRRGIRGSYPKQIMGIFKKTSSHFQPNLLKPSRLGFRDRIDIWRAGYAVSIAQKYPKAIIVQKTLGVIAKIIYCLSGIVFLPTVSLAIMKQEHLKK